MVFRDVGGILLEIYQVYFGHEVKGTFGGMPLDAMWHASERSLFEFLNEYDVCPALLSKPATF